MQGLPLSLEDELQQRLLRPQRHRLLQGFPAVPAMVPATPRGAELRVWDEPTAVRHLDGSLEPSRGAKVEAEAPFFSVDRGRGLLVGVIPHTQCVPRVEGCGFCTFPHDPANRGRRSEMVEAVAGDIDKLGKTEPLRGRLVEAIYLGGGTANLASPDEVTLLVQRLHKHFSIGDAELSLEGTASLFASWFGSHLRNLAKQPCARKRISVGIQTFHEGFLRAMGREKFGDQALLRKLLKQCRGLEIAASIDLLYNLPGQTTEQMESDVNEAIACGLEQICLYNLVLYEGLGTPWSREPEKLAAMPGNEEACERWLRLRERLLRAGYTQSTLTNFERSDVTTSPASFRYEVASFSPEQFDAIGFGPASLSTAVNWREQRGLKLLRRKHLGRPPWSGSDLMFRYDSRALRLLFVTRSLAKTAFSLGAYQKLFGAAFLDEFAPALAPLQREGLLALDETTAALTPRGMFFSDAVVSLLAQGTQTPGGGLHTKDLLAERPVAGEYLGMG